MTSVWENAGSPGSVPPASHPHGGRALLEHPSPRGTCLGGAQTPKGKRTTSPVATGAPTRSVKTGRPLQPPPQKCLIENAFPLRVLLGIISVIMKQVRLSR